MVGSSLNQPEKEEEKNERGRGQAQNDAREPQAFWPRARLARILVQSRHLHRFR